VTSAAFAAGILPQARRRRRAPSKKRIGCDSAEDIALSNTSKTTIADDNKNKVNKQSIFSNSFR